MKKGVRVVIILAVVFVVLAIGGFFAYTRLSGQEGERYAIMPVKNIQSLFFNYF